MELSNLLQDNLLRFCESSKDSDYSFDLNQLLATALNEYESQSGSGSASETPNPTPTTSPIEDSERYSRSETPRSSQEDSAGHKLLCPSAGAIPALIDITLVKLLRAGSAQKRWF